MLQVGDVAFPFLENPAEDERGLTAWYSMAAHEGSVISEDGGNPAAPAILAKDKWLEKGVKGGLFRLALAPVSCHEAVIYLQVAPMDPDDYRARLDVLKIPEQYSGAPAVKMTNTARIPLGPREPEAMRAGFALLPLININAAEDAPVTLPSSANLRREMAGTLRNTCKPRKCPSVNEFNKVLAGSSPPAAETPDLLWPLPRAREGAATRQGEFTRDCCESGCVEFECVSCVLIIRTRHPGPDS